MEKVLIIGGAGFIGSKLCEVLRAKGHNVAILDNFIQYSDPLNINYSTAIEYRKKLLVGVKIYRGDATVAYDMIKCLDDFQPDRIVHLAAVTRADINDDNITKAFQTSTLPILHLMEYYRNRSENIKRILYVSSSYAYGNFKRDYCIENDSKEPTSTYGGVKYSCEILLGSWGRRFGIPYTIVRPIAAYGPSDLNGKLSMQNIKKAIEEKKLLVMGSLDELSDYTYVDDLAEGMSLALFSDSSVGETFNLSSGKGVKLSEVIECFNALGYEVLPERAPFNKSRPRRGYLNIDKAREKLGYDPKTSLSNGLMNCIAYIDTHNVVLENIE